MVDLRRIRQDTITAIESIDLIAVHEYADQIIDKLRRQQTIFTCGNGGSAAQAMHLAAELVGRYRSKTRPHLKAICLNTDIAAMTAIANDFGYEHVFARQLAALGKRGDMLIAFSTSGASKNVINAIRQAWDEDISSLIITGRSHASNESPGWISVNDVDTARIQEAHQVIIHMLCEIIDEVFTI